MRVLLPFCLCACAPGGFSPGAFDPPADQTRTTLDVATTTGARSSVTLTPRGTRTVGAADLPLLVLTDPTGADAGLELAVQMEGPTLTLGAVRLEGALAGLDVDIVGAEPFVVRMDAPVGEPQTLTVDGTVVVGDPSVGTTGYLPFDFTWTVTEDDAVAPAPLGDLPGCRHATFASSAGPLEVTGELWTRDDIGFVHATLDSQPWGRLDGGASGYFGHDSAGGVTVVQAEQRIDPANPAFQLSSYDVAQAFDADKDVHAQMWLEYRWADADLARTDAQPPVDAVFSTVFGVFPSTVLPSPVGYLHPELQDEGFHYWVALVDQAAKNEPTNGIAYTVRATHLGTRSDPVLVGAFLRYHTWAP